MHVPEKDSEQALEKRLQALWPQRAVLDEPGFAELRKLVHRILASGDGDKNQVDAGGANGGDEQFKLIDEFYQLNVKLVGRRRKDAEEKPVDTEKLRSYFDTFVRIDRSLNQLWKRRDALSPQDWQKLHGLVHEVLGGIFFREHEGIPGAGESSGRRDLVDDFFADKVFRPVTRGAHLGRGIHSGALIVFFRNYLRDRIDRVPPEVRRPYEPATDGDGAVDPWDLVVAKIDLVIRQRGERELTVRKVLDEAMRACLAAVPASQPGWDVGTVSGSSGQVEEGDTCSRAHAAIDKAYEILREEGPDTPVVLEEAGLSLEAVIDAACAFLDAHGPWETLAEHRFWIRPYLAEHHCPEKGDHVPLSRLAKRCGIENHHVKAQRLGITSVGGCFERPEEFERTYLGRWLVSLGIRAELRQKKVIRAALETLCHVALLYKGRYPCYQNTSAVDSSSLGLA